MTPLEPHPLTAASRDPWIRAAAGFAFVLQIALIAGGDGARNGDAVEHLERAADLARGLELGADATRGPLLAVLLAAQRIALDAIGFTGSLALRLPMIGAALAASALALVGGASLSRAYGGPGAARACAWMIATSSVFLVWGGDTTSAPFATAAMLVGADRFARARTKAGAFAAGAVLGASIALKYQLFFLAPFFLLLPCAHGGAVRARRPLAICGLAASTAVLCIAADAVAYGDPFATAPAYLRANVLPPIYAVLHPILPDGARLGLHELLFDVEAGPAVREGSPLARQRPLAWYASELPAWFPLPWLALICAALMRHRSRREILGEGRNARARAVLALAVALHFAALSLKGAKELRLLFPLVPCLAVLFGRGIAALGATLASGSGRAAFAATCCAAASWPLLQLGGSLPSGELADSERHWSYAAAMRELGARAPRPPHAPWEVAAVFHFAIALEERPGASAARMPHPLDLISRASVARRAELARAFAAHGRVRFRAPSESSAPLLDRMHAIAAALEIEAPEARIARAADGFAAGEMRAPLEKLEPLSRALRSAGFAILEAGDGRPDWLLGHAQSFRDQRELFRAASAGYVLSGALFDPHRDSDLDELWVLARADRACGAWPFVHVAPAGAFERLRASLSAPIELLFLDAELRPTLELVGVDVEPRWARDGFAFSRWVWRARREIAEPGALRFARRATLGDGARQRDGALGSGLFDPGPWPSGELREEVVLLSLCGLGDPGRPSAFALWIAVFDAAGALFSPQDRSRFSRSPDGFARVGGGLVTRLADRTLPPVRDD